MGVQPARPDAGLHEVEESREDGRSWGKATGLTLSTGNWKRIMGHRKNLVVVYRDQRRADSLGCMGKAIIRTPNLEALAAKGTLYRRPPRSTPAGRLMCLVGRSWPIGRKPVVA